MYGSPEAGAAIDLDLEETLVDDEAMAYRFHCHFCSGTGRAPAGKAKAKAKPKGGPMKDTGGQLNVKIENKTIDERKEILRLGLTSSNVELNTQTIWSTSCSGGELKKEISPANGILLDFQQVPASLGPMGMDSKKFIDDNRDQIKAMTTLFNRPHTSSFVEGNAFQSPGQCGAHQRWSRLEQGH